MKKLLTILFAVALGLNLSAQTDYVDDWNPDADGDDLIGITDLLALLSLFAEADSDGDGIWDSVDDCIGVYDPCGVCNGMGEDMDEDGLCDDVDDCVGEYDECGVCNGPGPSFPVIDEILYATDSVFLEPLDEWYVFEYATDTLFTFVCPVGGCTNEAAENYNSFASEDDGSCVFAGQSCGIFFSEYAEGSANNSYLEIYNPTDDTIDLELFAIASTMNVVTNPGVHEFWNSFSDGATIAPGDVYIWAKEGSDSLILAEADQIGSLSWNGDDAIALVSGAEDDYVFVDIIGNFDGDPGAAWEVAGDWNGTWNHTMVRKESVNYGNGGDWFMSAGTNESDSEWLLFEEDEWSNIGMHTFSGSCSVSTEGCTDEAAGNYNPEAVVEDDSCVYGPSECGGASTVTFDGYTYALVAIGDQCWFAENLRNEHYANGEAIPGDLSDGDWSSTTSGAVTVFGEGTSTVWSGSDDEVSNLADYGRLYNWYAVDDARGLCPSGWHVPTDGEFMTLEMELGMSESEANGTSGRGTDQGTQMKSSASDSPAWNGTNTSGFSGLAGGFRYYSGDFYSEGYNGYFWSASANGTNAWYRELSGGNTEVSRDIHNLRSGFSVRCVWD